MLWPPMWIANEELPTFPASWTKGQELGSQSQPLIAAVKLDLYNGHASGSEISIPELAHRLDACNGDRMSSRLLIP